MSRKTRASNRGGGGKQFLDLQNVCGEIHKSERYTDRVRVLRESLLFGMLTNE